MSFFFIFFYSLLIELWKKELFWIKMEWRRSNELWFNFFLRALSLLLLEFSSCFIWSFGAFIVEMFFFFFFETKMFVGNFSFWMVRWLASAKTKRERKKKHTHHISHFVNQVGVIDANTKTPNDCIIISKTPYILRLVLYLNGCIFLFSCSICSLFLLLLFLTWNTISPLSNHNKYNKPHFKEDWTQKKKQ